MRWPWPVHFFPRQRQVLAALGRFTGHRARRRPQRPRLSRDKAPERSAGVISEESRCRRRHSIIAAAHIPHSERPSRAEPPRRAKPACHSADHHRPRSAGAARSDSGIFHRRGRREPRPADGSARRRRVCRLQVPPRAWHRCLRDVTDTTASRASRRTGRPSGTSCRAP